MGLRGSFLEGFGSRGLGVHRLRGKGCGAHGDQCTGFRV